MNNVCPYCGEMMQQGYIQSHYPIAWTPRKLKLFTFRAFYADDSRVLADIGAISAACATAYNCDKCKIVIIGHEK